MGKLFDTTPGARFLRAIRNLKWTVAAALAELVDNAFGAARGAASETRITWNAKSHELVVLDNGRGMEALGRLFKLGSDMIGRVPDDIGEFGSGGTMALLWLASKVAIWSLRDGLVSHEVVDWSDCIRNNRFPKIDESWVRARPGTLPAELLALHHGTMIRLSLLRERRFFVSNVQRELAEMYSPAARTGRRLVWVAKGREVLLGDPIALPDDAESFDLVLDVGDGKQLSASGRVGIIDGLPLSKSHVLVGFAHRIITKTRDCYRSPEGNKSYNGPGVTGWIQLGDGWQEYLTTTKDGINDTPVWDALMAYIYRQIEPLLEQAETKNRDLVFEEVKLSLEQMFNSEVEVERTGRGPSGGRGAASTEKLRLDLGDARSPRADTEPGDAQTKQSEARTGKIVIDELSDTQMEGRLCVVEIINENVVHASVNKDHERIQEALEAKPVNRMALAFMIASELAVALSDSPPCLKAMLPARDVADVERRDDDVRRGVIIRLLMDRVRAA
jgi:hypothetical protein